jgi:hypothetical protein
MHHQTLQHIRQGCRKTALQGCRQKVTTGSSVGEPSTTLAGDEQTASWPARETGTLLIYVTYEDTQTRATDADRHVHPSAMWVTSTSVPDCVDGSHRVAPEHAPFRCDKAILQSLKIVHAGLCIPAEMHDGVGNKRVLVG